MLLTRVFTGADGESHFEDLDIPLDASGLGAMSSRVATTGAWFRETPGSLVLDYHPAPRRQFVIFLAGIVELDCGNGEVRRFAPGDVLLADDTTGRGHVSRDVEGPRRQVFVAVADDLDVAPWRPSR